MIGYIFQHSISGFLILVFGYKAKVFKFVVQKELREVAEHFKVFEKLKNRRAIDDDQYELLYGTTARAGFCRRRPLGPRKVGQEGVTLGAR